MSLRPKTADEDSLPTRKSLVGRLRNIEDNESWREFFETYWKLIFAFAVKSGCTESEAEEVVQETIISVSRKMPDFKYDPAVCSFKGWLMHVANWRVIDQFRKRNHKLVDLSAEANGSSTALFERIADPLAPQVEQLWSDEWKQNLMSAAIERVKRRCNPEHFQMFYLAAVKRLPIPAITRTLGVNRSQIYLAKHRVASLVKKELKYLEMKML